MANNILDAVEREYNLIRQKNELKLQTNLAIARQNEEFAKTEREIKSKTIEIAKAENFLGDIALADKLRKEREQLAKKQAENLRKTGLTEKDITLNYTCEKCKDTGFINGKPCACFNEKWKRHVFLNSDLDPVPNILFKNDTANKPEKLQKLYSVMKKYVEKFPSTKTRNFLFTGKTGCGKTFLASAVAGELSKAGFNVVFITSTALNQLFLKMHVSKYNERVDYMDTLIGCDLLVIDDLGTECIYKNVTIENYLSLVSERLAKNKHTIITTNLTGEEILNRYNERFFSRITEKKHSAVVVFDDVNFRAQK